MMNIEQIAATVAEPRGPRSTNTPADELVRTVTATPEHAEASEHEEPALVASDDDDDDRQVMASPKPSEAEAILDRLAAEPTNHPRPSEWRSLKAERWIRTESSSELEAAVSLRKFLREARQELAALPTLAAARRQLREAKQRHESLQADFGDLALGDLVPGDVKAIIAKGQETLDRAAREQRAAEAILNRVQHLRQILTEHAPAAIHAEVCRRRERIRHEAALVRRSQLRTQVSEFKAHFDPNSNRYLGRDPAYRYRTGELDGWISRFPRELGSIVAVQPGTNEIQVLSAPFQNGLRCLREDLLPRLERELGEVESAAASLELEADEPYSDWIVSGVVPREYL